MKRSEAATTMRHFMHEVRTPLTRIIGYCEMLQEEVTDLGLTDLSADLDEIRSAAFDLQQIVESMFQDAPVEMPLKEHVAEDASHEPSEEARTSGSVLVVDDEKKIRDLMLRRLGRMGHTVTVAANASEALERIGDGEIDIVLLDLMMPDTGGLEILKSLRRLHSPIELPVIIVSGLGASEDTVTALAFGANDFVTKPLDFSVLDARMSTQLTLRQTALEVTALSRQLEVRNTFIRRMLGRYVSDEVAASLLDDPSGIELRGEKRSVTVLKTDLRGFTTLTETCGAAQVVQILNRYLGTMTEIVARRRGTVDEFQGDALIALFGAPVSGSDDAERAVLAALEMQLAMPEINARNRANGLPEIEMGIGIATGEAIVGNIGTETRAKYGVVGRPINLAARIESYSLGGEVLIDEATKKLLGRDLMLNRSTTVHPKGIGESVLIHSIAALGRIRLPDVIDDLTELDRPVDLRFVVVTGSQVGEHEHKGALHALSAKSARLVTDGELPALANLCIHFVDEQGGVIPGECYAKVVDAVAGLIGFTTRSAALDAITAQVVS